MGGAILSGETEEELKSLNHDNGCTGHNKTQYPPSFTALPLDETAR
jgi:hypothetical protein